MKIFWVYLCFVMFQLDVFAQEPVVISEENITVNEQGLAGMVKDWTFVKLDLSGVTPEGGMITAARYVDRYILLEGLVNEGKYFLLFDREGKLLTRLDSRNMDMKSTNEITRCSVDPFGKRILLVCGWKRVVYWYDFSGNLLNRQEFDADGVISELYYLDAATVLCCNQIAEKHETVYFIAKDDFKNCKSLKDYAVTYMPGAIPFANKAASVNAGRATLMMPFCDTVFDYSNQEKTPRYILQAHKTVPDDFVFEPGSDYFKLLKQCRTKEMEERECLYETDRTLWFGYTSGVMCFDKISGKTVYADKGDRVYNARMILPVDLIGETPDALVAAFTSGELRDMEQRMKAEGMVCGKQLREFLQETTTGDCVALVFYRLNNL